jgi:hypothetical protein
LHALGMDDGWVQELSAERSYRPDFARRNPFEADRAD